MRPLNLLAFALLSPCLFGQGISFSHPVDPVTGEVCTGAQMTFTNTSIIPHYGTRWRIVEPNGAATDFLSCQAATNLVATPNMAGSHTVQMWVTQDQNPPSSGNCTWLGPVGIMFFAIGPPTAQLTSVQENVCLGQSGTLTALLDGRGPFVINWSDGVVESGLPRGTHTRTVTPATVGTQTYSITGITDSCNRTGQVAGQTAVTAYEVPTATVVPPASASVCLGQSVQLGVNITGIGPVTLTWSDGRIDTGITSTPFVRTVGFNTAGTFSIGVVGISNPVCSSGNILGQPVTLTVSDPPTAALSGTQAICLGQAASLRADLTGTSPWTLQWSDGVSESGITTSPHFRSVSPSTTTNYQISSLLDATGCSNQGSGTVQISVLAAPTAALSGPNQACVGQLVSLQVALVGTAPFSITWSDGLTESNLAGPSHVRTLTPTAVGGLSLSLLTMSDANCPGTTSGSVTLQVGQPTLAVSGGGTFCVGEMATVRVDTAASLPLTLSWQDGFTETVTSTPHFRNVPTNQVGATTYLVSSVGSSGCPVAVSGSATVDVILGVTASLDGDVYVGFGRVASIRGTLGGVPPFTVVWNDGFTQTASTTSLVRGTLESGIVNFSLASVTDARGCTAGPSNSISVIPESAPDVSGHIYSIERYALQLHRIELSSGATVSTQAVSVPALFGVPHFYGMARNPMTGTVYVATWDGVNTYLGIIDLSTAVVQIVGTIGRDVRGLAFATNGVLYANEPFTNDLFSLNLATAQATLVAQMGASASPNAAIAWDRNARRLFHSAGDLALQVFQSIDPLTLSIAARPLGGSSFGGINSMTHVSGQALACCDTLNQLHVVLDDSGYTYGIGSLSHQSGGMVTDSDAWICLRGTGDDFSLLAGNNGGLVTGDCRQLTPAGAAVGWHLSSPRGTLDGSPVGLVAQLYSTNGPPPTSPIGGPDIYVDISAFLPILNPISLPSSGFLGVSQLPPAITGYSVRLQAYLLSSQTHNGAYALSAGIDLIVQ